MKRSATIWVVTIVSTLLCALLYPALPANAEWIQANGEPPEIERLTSQPFAQPQFYNKNQDCTPEYTTYLYKWIFSEQSHTSCVTTNNTGVFTLYKRRQYLQRTGADRMGVLNIGSALSLAPPNSDHLITFSGSGDFRTARIYRNLGRNISTTSSITGRLHHSVTQAPNPFPNDSTKKISYMTASASYSGDWVIARANNGSFARISTKTGEALYFAKSSGYPRTRIKQLVTAVSSDGRYAAIASQYYGDFKLYDLSSCEGNEEIKACKELDVEPYLKERFPGYNNTRYVRFRSESTIELQISTGYRETYELTTLLISAPGQKAELFNYLALGDSFASGEGAYSYKPETNTQENRCHLSLQAYPHRIGGTLGLDSYDSVACSGAIKNDILLSPIPDEYEGQQEPKIAKRDRVISGEYATILSSRTSGYINQIDFIREYKPRIITVSIGGNDIGFADIIKRCVLGPDTCYKTTYQKQQLEEEIYSLYPKLTQLYKDIRFAGDPSAQVYVISYPSIIAPNNRCDINVGFNASEVDFAQTLTNAINHTIFRAAHTAGIHYVDATNALENHRLCEYTSVPAVHGITLNNDYANYRKYGLVAAESFHPTSYGHDLLARKILDTSSNFRSADFPPAPYTPPRVGDGSGFLTIEELITEVSPAKRRQDRHITTPIIYDQETLTIKAGDNDARYMLRENEEYQVYLYSDPLYLGSLTTDENGTLSGEVPLPENIPPGYHTINIIGQDVHGDQLQVYQNVYVLDEVRLQELKEAEQQSEPVNDEPIDNDQNAQNEPPKTAPECNGSEQCILPLPILSPSNPETDADDNQVEADDDTQTAAEPATSMPPTNSDTPVSGQQPGPTISTAATTSRFSAPEEQDTPASTESTGQVAGVQDIAQTTANMAEQDTESTTQQADKPANNTDERNELLIFITVILLFGTVAAAVKGTRKATT